MAFLPVRFLGNRNRQGRRSPLFFPDPYTGCYSVQAVFFKFVFQLIHAFPSYLLCLTFNNGFDMMSSVFFFGPFYLLDDKADLCPRDRRTALYAAGPQDESRFVSQNKRRHIEAEGYVFFSELLHDCFRRLLLLRRSIALHPVHPHHAAV